MAIQMTSIQEMTESSDMDKVTDIFMSTSWTKIMLIKAWGNLLETVTF